MTLAVVGTLNTNHNNNNTCSDNTEKNLASQLKTKILDHAGLATNNRYHYPVILLSMQEIDMRG